MKNFYVVQLKTTVMNNEGKREEFVNLLTFEEAVKKKWIDKNGNRVWVVSPEDERVTITAVYGFNLLEKAILFYDILCNNQIGMKVTEA